MRRPLPLLIVAVLAAVPGLISVSGALFLDDVTPFLRVSSTTSGSLLLIGAWLLLLQRRWAVALFGLSATVYLLSILLPAFERHGSEAFSALMSAFYWSAGFRVFLPVTTLLVLKRVEAKTNTAVNPSMSSASRQP